MLGMLYLVNALSHYRDAQPIKINKRSLKAYLCILEGKFKNWLVSNEFETYSSTSSETCNLLHSLAHRRLFVTSVYRKQVKLLSWPDVHQFSIFCFSLNNSARCNNPILVTIIPYYFPH
jgi:hypothetical protein